MYISKLGTFESETVIGPYGVYIRVNFNSETISEHTVSSSESLLVTLRLRQQQARAEPT